VLDESAVPQEPHEERQKDHIRDENENVIQSVLAVAGLKNTLHLFIMVTEKSTG